MIGVTIPTFECPILPVSINKYAKTVESNTFDWAYQVGLIASEEDYQQLSMANISRFSGRIYSNACITDLQLANDWLAWILFYDDLGDKTRQSLPQLKVTQTKLENILNGAGIIKQDEPLVQAFYDIQQRLFTKTKAGHYFIRSVKQFFQSNLWETINHVHSTPPCMMTYFKMRPFTGGLYTFFELAQALGQINLLPQIRENVYLQQLALMANNHATWSNDVFSFIKETKNGNYTNNLVYILQQEYNLSIQDAVNYIAKLCKDEMQAFFNLNALLPSLGIEIDTDVEKFLSFWKGIIRGHLDWAPETGRYAEMFSN